MAKFIKLTTGDTDQPDTIFVNRARVIFIEDAKDKGALVHCNDGETLAVFEKPQDIVNQFNGEDD
ncbi:MAG TPA: hypothetical protein VEU08_14620 [Vicinamibacterales bacterium]|nr:hypothetical protein [Vicinamibacterales bacterium]